MQKYGLYETVAKTFLYFCGVIRVAFHRHEEIEGVSNRHFVITALLGALYLTNKVTLELIFVRQVTRKHPAPIF